MAELRRAGLRAPGGSDARPEIGHSSVSAQAYARSEGMQAALALLIPPLGGAPERRRVRLVLAEDELERERGLCERAKTGDRTALGALLSAHGPRLFRSVLLPRLGSRVRAEEALSLTYLKVVERFEQF